MAGQAAAFLSNLPATLMDAEREARVLAVWRALLTPYLRQRRAEGGDALRAFRGGVRRQRWTTAGRRLASGEAHHWRAPCCVRSKPEATRFVWGPHVRDIPAGQRLVNRSEVGDLQRAALG
jgi:hypothetical protein